MQPDALQLTIEHLRLQLTRAVRYRLAWQSAAITGCSFWVLLAIDRWLEPSPQVRTLALFGLVVAVLVWSVRIAWPMLRERFSDQAIAQLIAMKQPKKGDLIATALDLDQPNSLPHVDKNLANETRKQANAVAAGLVDLRLVHDFRESAWAGAATIAWGAVVMMLLANPQLGVIFAKRLALSHDAWPRSVRLLPIDFVYDSNSGVWQRKVARGEQTEIEINAMADLIWRLPNDLRAKIRWNREVTTRQEFTRVGRPTSEGRQQFRLPIESVTSDINLTLRGGDARLRLRLLAVDRPTLTGLVVKVIPPKYLGQPIYEQQAAVLNAIPAGASLRVESRINKPLEKVVADLFTDDAEPTLISSEIDSDKRSFFVNIPPLATSSRLSMSWVDADGIASSEAYVQPFEVTPDDAPLVELKRDGISKGVTPRAVLRLQCGARDDHRLARVGLSAQIGDDPKIEIVLLRAANQSTDLPCSIDLLTLDSLRLEEGTPITPGTRIVVRAFAEDYYDLQPRQPAFSEPLEFEVVTDEEVLARLSVQEQELRSRLETAISDARRLSYVLERVSNRESRDKQFSLSDSLLQVRKLRAEVVGIVKGFTQARDILVNNRLDQPVLLERIQARIIEPLESCDSTNLAPLANVLAKSNPSDLPVAQRFIDSAIISLEQVLSQIQANETYNQVVAELRDLIREQRRLNRLTDLQRTEQAKQLLLGPEK